MRIEGFEISPSVMEEIDGIRRKESEEGYAIPDEDYGRVLIHCVRKCRLTGKDADYLPLLVGGEIRHYLLRAAINSVSIAVMDLMREEGTEDERCDTGKKIRDECPVLL